MLVLHGAASVSREADQIDVCPLEEPAEAEAHDRVIVDDDDAEAAAVKPAVGLTSIHAVPRFYAPPSWHEAEGGGKVIRARRRRR